MMLEKISEDKFWRRVKRPVEVIDIQAGREELSGLGRAGELRSKVLSAIVKLRSCSGGMEV